MKKTAILIVSAIMLAAFLTTGCASTPTLPRQENSPPKIDYYGLFKDCFKEFQLWKRNLPPVDKVCIITLRPDEKLPPLPKYEMIGSATMLAENTARKNGMIAGRVFAQKGAHVVVIYGADKEEEQKGKATAKGLGSAGSIFGPLGGGGGVLGYASRSEWIKFSGKRIGQVMAFRFLETDVKEWQARLARKKAEKAAKEAPLVIAKKVAEIEVMPPPVVIYFDFDSYEIKEPEKIKEIANWLVKHPEYRVQFEGHCCLIGPEDYNYPLGRKRVLAVVMELIEMLEKEPYNISREKIIPNLIFQYVSLGEDKPVVLNKTIEEGKPNRRVEIRIVTPSSGEVARGEISGEKK